MGGWGKDLDKHKGSELTQNRVLLGQILPKGKRLGSDFMGLASYHSAACLQSHQQVQSDTSETQLMSNQETSKWQAWWQKGVNTSRGEGHITRARQPATLMYTGPTGAAGLYPAKNPPLRTFTNRSHLWRLRRPPIPEGDSSTAINQTCPKRGLPKLPVHQGALATHEGANLPPPPTHTQLLKDPHCWRTG